MAMKAGFSAVQAGGDRTVETGIWRKCAEIYLEKMWFGQNEQDRWLVSAFSEGAVTCEMLRDLCSPTKYGVARTVPGHGPEKYGRFAEMLSSYRSTVMTRENVPEIIEGEFANMQKAYGRGFLSAITKAFWMMKQHPVVIYDSKARSGLRQLRPAPEYEDYRSYFNAWFRFFDDPHTQNGLDDGLSWLPESPAARALIKGGKTDSEEIQRLSASTLFRNRATDIRLFYAGGGVL
jgi:hypothetical protein